MCHYLVFTDNFFLCQKKNKKFLYGKVALRILCPSFVCKLPHECEDITKNAWRTPLNAQCNIKHRLQYSLFLTFLDYHRNRLFLYFLVNYRVSIISLLFGELSSIDYFLTFLGIDSQLWPWFKFEVRVQG